MNTVNEQAETKVRRNAKKEETEKLISQIPEKFLVKHFDVFGPRGDRNLSLIAAMEKKGDFSWELAIQALDYLLDNELFCVHVRPTDSEMIFTENMKPVPAAKSGLTIVYYRVQNRWDTKNNFVKISTAWCHKNDYFNPKLGRLLAAINFVRGEHTSIRLPIKGRYTSQLRVLFTPLVQSQVVFN